MKKEKIKHIEVSESTHTLAKIKAAENGMTLKGYINFLVKNDSK